MQALRGHVDSSTHDRRKLAEEDYRLIYIGERYAPDAFLKDQVHHGYVIYDFVKEIFGNVYNPTVFDVGRGAGGVLVSFSKAGWRTYGCDIGGEYLQRGRDEGLIRGGFLDRRENARTG